LGFFSLLFIFPYFVFSRYLQRLPSIK
jgi:hypothetical protein